jgi:hypothetical protein
MKPPGSEPHTGDKGKAYVGTLSWLRIPYVWQLGDISPLKSVDESKTAAMMKLQSMPTAQQIV